jgi:transcriptional regulator with XRE-family HTH domain
VTIATLRLAKGLSQSQLAAAIGTSQSMLSLIECRRQRPGEDTIRALARELSISFDQLMDALANG